MTKVLWFSRHVMSTEQLEALQNKLGEITITQINGTAPNVYTEFEASINGSESSMVKPLKEWIQEHEVIAIVAPINLQQQFLSVSGNKPVIMTENARIFNEEGKVTFKFVKWFKLIKIEVITENF